MKNSSLIIITCLMLTGLSGCSSTSQNASTASLTPQQRDALLNMLRQQDDQQALLESWQQARPSVMRLVAIDSELKLLIEQLDNLANVPDVEVTAAPPISQPKPLDEESSNTVDRPATDVTTEPTLKQSESGLAGMYTVQLVAMDSVEKLRVAWQQITEKKPTLGSGVVPYYEQSNLNGRVIYRLKAGIFNTKQQAFAFCDELTASNIPCFTSQYGKEVVNL